jgi:hypothetical protein
MAESKKRTGGRRLVAKKRRPRFDRRRRARLELDVIEWLRAAAALCQGALAVLEDMQHRKRGVRELRRDGRKQER